MKPTVTTRTLSISGLGQVVTVEEAAHLLGVTRQRVHQLVGEKLLAGKILSGATFISRQSVERYAVTPRKAGWPKGKPRRVGRASKALAASRLQSQKKA